MRIPFTSRTAKIAVAGVLAFGAASGAALAGALPAPVQSRLSGVVDNLGLALPTGQDENTTAADETDNNVNDSVQNAKDDAAQGDATLTDKDDAAQNEKNDGAKNEKDDGAQNDGAANDRNDAAQNEKDDGTQNKHDDNVENNHNDGAQSDGAQNEGDQGDQGDANG